MQGGVSSHETRLAIQKLDQLPAMPVVAQQFLAAISDPDVDVADLAAIIERDPGLLARVVGLANAAYFGYPTPVTNAHDAILKVLGLNTTKNLTLSIVLSGPFDTKRCQGFELNRYWSRALLTATLAQKLSRIVERSPRPAPGDAYLCGLLHNFGLLAMVHVFPAGMAAVYTALNESVEGSQIALERDALGTDHLQVGGWLARRWHLPAAVLAVVEHYVDGAYRGEHATMVSLVNVSARWAETLLHDEHEAPPVQEMLPDALAIDPQRCQIILEQLGEHLDEIRALANILALD